MLEPAPLAVPPESDVLIVGAGPAAMATSLALACHRPDLDVTVIDPAGRWLDRWDHQLAAQAIPHLRSPAVHHPHPYPFAIFDAVPPDAFVRRARAPLPRTEAFSAFCHHTVEEHGIEDVVAGAVVDISATASGARVTLGNGPGRTVVTARHVVVAANHRRPNLPSWAHEGPGVRHSSTVDLRSAPTDGRVLIVGGGISAGHLAIGACERGNEVTLVTRRDLTLRRYDTHPTWVGQRKLREFEERPASARRRLIDHARGGGSMPAWMARRLEELGERGRLTHLPRTDIARIDEVGAATAVRTTDGRTVVVDEVWLATGAAVDVAADPLLAPVIAQGRCVVHDGLPELDDDLTIPGTNIHLTGAAAGLVLGPSAGNLIGHRRAAQRVVAGMSDEDPSRADRLGTLQRRCRSL